MAVTLNASTSTGLVQSADTSGSLNIQSNGTTVLGVTSTGASVTGTQSVSGDLSFNSGYGSVATAYGCRAWVNFNGTGTVAIRASGNVSSITDNGAGKYVVNFSTAMPDVNYAANASCAKDNDADDGAMRIAIGSNTTNIPSTSVCPITITRGDGTAVDSARVFLSIIR